MTLLEKAIAASNGCKEKINDEPSQEEIDLLVAFAIGRINDSQFTAVAGGTAHGAGYAAWRLARRIIRSGYRFQKEIA